MRGRLEQREDPLLLADAADEEHVRRADPVAIEGIAALGAAEGGGVDAIVQHDDARRIDAEMREDVVAHLRGDRDDAARLFDGGRSAQDDTT